MVSRSLGALVSLLVLGFVMGFSPSLYGVTVHVLTRVRRPRTALLFLTGGLAFGSTILLLAFRSIDPRTLSNALRGQVEELLLTQVVDYLAGFAFLVAGVIAAARARRPRAMTGPPRLHESHPQRLFGVGFANAVIGTSGLATMYITGRVLTQVSSDVALQALSYLLFLLALAGPYLALGYLWRRIPRLAVWVTRSYDWVARFDYRPLVAAALLVAGAVFVGLAIWAPHSAQF